MKQLILTDLRKAVDGHSGAFHCVLIRDESRTRIVRFAHRYAPPSSLQSDFPFEPLRAFYEVFGDLTLFHEPESDEAAFRIAAPGQWAALDDDFRLWLDGLDDEEKRELLPDWIHDCLVIGEIPQSGNYLLIPRTGESRGCIFEFEHDGFEFIERAIDIEHFVMAALEPDAPALTCMASHLRFIVTDSAEQWWIEEMHDSRGAIVRTCA